MYPIPEPLNISGETVVAAVYSVGVVVLGILTAFLPAAQNAFVVLVAASGPIVVHYFGSKKMDTMNKQIQALAEQRR